MTVAPADAPRFSVTGPFAAGLEGQDNLVTRAEAAFRTVFAIAQPHALTLDSLPVASGVGRRIGRCRRDPARRCRPPARRRSARPRFRAIAAALGADVPACLLGRARVRQRARRRAGADRRRRRPARVAGQARRGGPQPARSLPAWDGVDRGPIGEGATLGHARAGRNDLQPPAEAMAISEAVALLAAQPGVLLARMSGSGATCSALFAEEADRRRRRCRGSRHGGLVARDGRGVDRSPRRGRHRHDRARPPRRAQRHADRRVARPRRHRRTCQPRRAWW
ncbi:4-(cytidine 5'-diphospho)-2-C-methyl-D-erythritol kinase [Sphingomonas sp. MMS24-JH45]